MSATSSRRGLSAPFLVTLLLASLSPVALAGEQELPSPASLVKVLMVQPEVLSVDGKIVAGARIHSVVSLPGVVVDARGLVVTFVAAPWPLLEPEGIKFELVLHDGRRVSASLVGVDERLQLAVLEAKQVKNQSATLGPRPGKEDPLSLVSVTQGGWSNDLVHVVRSKKRRHTPEEEVQVCGHAAAKDLTNCAGTLAWDGRQRFLGVISGIAREGLASGRRFTLIPAATIRATVLEIAEIEDNLRAGWLGITAGVRDNTIWIDAVEFDSPASKARLMPGDQILKIEGEPVSEWAHLVSMVRWRGPGADIALTVSRHGREIELLPRLSVRPLAAMPGVEWIARLPGDLTDNGEAHLTLTPEYKTGFPNQGFVAFSLRGPLCSDLGAPDHALLVQDVIEGSPAASHGFKIGDVLCVINGVPIGRLDDVGQLFASAKDGVVQIRYIRGGKTLTESIRIQ